MILLDTCTLLWLAGDPKRLSSAAKEAIRSARGAIYVSSVSALEIGIKVRKGKLKLALKDPFEWFARAIEFHGLQELPLNAQVAFQSARLKAHHHDPADRVLVATASALGCKIVTPDSAIVQYSEVKCVW